MFDPTPFLKPLVWVVSIIFALNYGFSFSGNWQSIALYLNQSASAATDPIFNNSVSFYLFSLPVYELLNNWFLKLSIIILVAAVVYSILTFIAKDEAGRKTRYKALSIALALLAVTIAFGFLSKVNLRTSQFQFGRS